MRAVQRFVLNATMPEHAGVPGNNKASLDAFLDEFTVNAAPIMRIGFYAAVAVYVLSPVFTIKIPLPAFWLSDKQQTRHMESYSESRNMIIAQLWMLQKMIAALCWGMDASVRAYFGYEPLEGDPGTFQTGSPGILSAAYGDQSLREKVLTIKEAKL